MKRDFSNIVSRPEKAEEKEENNFLFPEDFWLREFRDEILLYPVP